MEYPIWDLTTFGGGFFIALISVFHVFLSHLAVGGGLFLPIFEGMAYKRDNPHLLDYVKKHTYFFLLITMVLSGMTGVGIWFTISLIAPAATSTLIHTFVFGWATEWVCFLAEIVALLIYHYGFKKMNRRDHQIIGWLYFLFAWLSLVLINGIIGFMLTPGDWLETRSFWDGFLNPSFWPSALFRTAMAAMIAGLFGFITAHRVQDEETREFIYRACAKWTALPLVIAMAAGWWYFSVLPPEATARLALTAARISSFANMIPLVAAGLFLLGLVMIVRLPREARIALSIILLVLGQAFIGSFEFLRESSRKPYVIHDYMYSNQIPVADVAAINKAGILNTAKWTANTEVTEHNVLEAGRELYMLECIACHSIGGPMNNILPLTAKYPLTGMVAKLTGQGRINPIMPPFAGTEAEKYALATFIVDGLHGGKLENKPFTPKDIPLDIPPFDAATDAYVLLAWNNLGMHCISDSYANWVLLPPANDIYAQLIKRGDKPAVITKGIEITYHVEPDFQNPAARSDFWKHVQSIFGARPDDNIGLAGHGLDGHMKLVEEQKSFEAKLLPVEPYPASGGFNPFPVFTVEAHDKATGKLLAVTKTVAPTSSEMGCKNCHGGGWKMDGLVGISDSTGRDVLNSHDRLSNTQLAAAAAAGKPMLCQSCHADPVLGARGNSKRLNLPAAIHGFHANFLTGRGSEACAYCHPNRTDGPTKCLRGAHATAGIGCVDCHGYLEDHALSLLKKEQENNKPGATQLMKNLNPVTVASKEAINPRNPWTQEPDCRTCHSDPQTMPKAKTSNAFNAWTSGGDKLYRNSSDKLGQVMCIACHNSPHANYPAVNKYGVNRDNIAPLQYQGNTRAIGMDGNCGVCHLKEVTERAHHIVK